MNYLKKIKLGAIFLMCAAMLLTMVGCGSGDKPYNYNLSDYVTVGEYTGIEYEAFQVEVTDEEVQQEIDSDLKQHGQQEELTTGTIEKNEFVNLDVTCIVDGEVVENGSAKGYTVQVGTGGMLEDVDKAFIGKKTGDTFSVDTTFPEDYELSEEMAGKDVTFEIKINKRFKVNVPQLDESFVTENTEYKTVDEYKEAMKTTLYEQKMDSARYEAGQSIWKKVLEASEALKYPEAELEKEKENQLESFKNLCTQYNITFEDALSNILKTDQAGLDAQIEKDSQEAIKSDMVMYAIARENDLKISKKEMKEYLDDVLDANEMNEEEFKEQYSMSIEEYAIENGIETYLLYDKVVDFLVDKGVAV